LLVVVFISGAVVNPLARSRVSAFCCRFSRAFLFSLYFVFSIQVFAFLVPAIIAVWAKVRFSFSRWCRNPCFSEILFYFAFSFLRCFFLFSFFVLESVLDFFKDLFGARPCWWRLHSLCLSLDTLWSSRFRNPDIQRSIVLWYGVPHLQVAKDAPSFLRFICLCNIRRFKSSFRKSIGWNI
jgi:hypothetical protein